MKDSLKTIPKFGIKLGTRRLQQEGLLAYEYNPFRNLRFQEDYNSLQKITSSNYDATKKVYHYVEVENPDNIISDVIGTIEWYEEEGVFKINGIKYFGYYNEVIPKGTLNDLDTEKLSFSLSNPVDMDIQPSYDGSVNIVINDDKNNPLMINSRFSPTGMNTYKIVDRVGSNDTNIYDYETFSSDTSLYKISNNIAKVNFDGITLNGNLKVGNYVFYFKLADDDGNETDFVAESGIVSCYIGDINNPFSARGGIEDENTYKSVTFSLSNLDPAYSYVNVYYTRTTASLDGAELTTAHKINHSYNISNNSARVYITGLESTKEVSINEINTLYNLASSVASQTIVQNRLFFGNIKKPSIDYKELTDISLRFLPVAVKDADIGYVNEHYKDTTGSLNSYEYYNPLNIYNRVGYWPGEIYRFGVVYILDDYSLSPVFNIRGTDKLKQVNEYTSYEINNPVDGSRQYIPIDKNNHFLQNSENSKGVVKITENIDLSYGNIAPIGLRFYIESKCIQLLKNQGIRGLFFVRQKRLKTRLCQAVTTDLEAISYLPIVNKHIESFINNKKILTHDFQSRLREVSKPLKNGSLICPEYELNQAYFNQFFTSSDFYIKRYSSIDIENVSERLYYIRPKNLDTSDNLTLGTLTSVGDAMKYVKGRNQTFSSSAGDAADASKFSYIIKKNVDTDNVNIIRGNFGPYLGAEGLNTIEPGIVDIMIPGYTPSYDKEYFEIRFRDNSSFFAISDRFDLNDYNKVESDQKQFVYYQDVYRGDCYICNFTHRMCRNFQDSEAPNNDTIIDPNTWKDHFRQNTSDAAEKRALINRGDVNAIRIGHWVTVKILSNINLSLRCNDYSYTTELGLTGTPRSFYPLSPISVMGNTKIPESSVSNAGLNKSVSDKYNFEQPYVPAIKNVFNTRILYSDLSINNSYKNGFRVFRNTNYRDYPTTYGSITKLLEWGGNIICIFEHGIGVIAVNERTIATSSAGGNAFITTSNILPENPNIISSMYGSQWKDSIVQTPYGVYGIDTVAKKIWRISIKKYSFMVDVISDFKVQKFLNDNIFLTDKELTPVIGLRNVKSHYNAYKGDIMFTFYNSLNTLEEKAWNLCYNEILQRFITFYSWIPSFSQSIDNIFFSFDNNASKNILCSSLTYSNYCDIQIDNNILKYDDSSNSDNILIGTLSISLDNTININDFKNLKIVYEIGNSCISGFTINKNQLYITRKVWNRLRKRSTKEVFKVPISCSIEYNHEDENSQLEGKTVLSISTIIYIKFDNYDSTNQCKTYFWKHGQAGLTATKEDIKPCKWYGKQHPFEFEIIVTEHPDYHKIFTDLQIIANKAEPESIHFEISGDVYTFADDLKNMFFRQEAIKNLYQYNGGDIVYDYNYLNIIPTQRDILGVVSEYKEKSTEFPLYYSRTDTINEIEDYYQSKSSSGKDYQRMSGSEVVYDKTKNQFNIATHIKVRPFKGIYTQSISKEMFYRLLAQNIYGLTFIYNDKVYSSDQVSSILDSPEKIESAKFYRTNRHGRLNGNADYIENKWYLQIPSIIYKQCNEKEWKIKKGSLAYPPLNLVNNPLPESMEELTIENINDIPANLTNLGYNIDNNSFQLNKWSNTKETRIRDRYVKVKVRYSGSDLAIIYALKTLYTISYA